MDDYEIKNYKLAGATSSAKAALFDITSELNVKILSLDNNDPEQAKLKEELTNRLKSVIDITNSLYDQVVLIDKDISGVVTETPAPEVTEEEPVVEDDDIVQISDKAIEDMMNVENEDDATEVSLETEEESVEEPVLEPVVEDTTPEDSGAIVLNFADYERLKGNKTSEEKPVEEENVESTEETSDDKLFDLDNTDNVELKEENEASVEEETKEDVPSIEPDKEDAIVLNLADYEKLKGKKVSEEKPEGEETTEEVTEEEQEDTGEKLIDLDAPKEEPVEEASAEESVEETVEDPSIEENTEKESIEDTTDEAPVKEESEEESAGEVPEEESEEEPTEEVPAEESEEETADEVPVEETSEEESTEEESAEAPVEETPIEETVEEETSEEMAPVIETPEGGINESDLEEVPKVEKPEEEEPAEVKPTVEESDLEDVPEKTEVVENEEESTEETPEEEEPIENSAPAIETTPPAEAASTGEEPKELNETEQAIEAQKQSVTNKTISYIINKDNIDVAKAILVTSLQFEKLLLSRDEQKTICKLRKYMVMPSEKEEESSNLEAMLQQAEDLYKEGNTEAAEALYNKISELNGN